MGWKILLYGCALMLIGAAIGRQLQLENSADTLARANHVREILPLLPVVTGALLALSGATRIVLTMRPAYLLPLGLLLDVVALLIPGVVARFFPQTGRERWSLLSLLPLFAIQVVGLMFLSVGFLRLLIQMSQRRKTRSARK